MLVCFDMDGTLEGNPAAGRFLESVIPWCLIVVVSARTTAQLDQTREFIERNWPNWIDSIPIYLRSAHTNDSPLDFKLATFRKLSNGLPIMIVDDDPEILEAAIKELGAIGFISHSGIVEHYAI